MPQQFSVVITTTANKEQAESLARSILDARLAACIQVQAITSFYSWKGEQCSDQESLLLIKTRHELYPSLEAHIKTHHSYETPEIIELPITQGLPAYLSWIDEVTQ